MVLAVARKKTVPDDVMDLFFLGASSDRSLSPWVRSSVFGIHAVE
jgi:hypothetical protein